MRQGNGRNAHNLAPPSRQKAGRLLLRPEEAAEVIGVCRARIFPMLASGEIKSIKIGRSRRVPVAELEAWVASKLAEQTA